MEAIIQMQTSDSINRHATAPTVAQQDLLPEGSAAPGICHNNQGGFIKTHHKTQVGSGDVAFLPIIA